ncbi:DgyrCDS10091 [Dimorphilus gyrociliatus]|uniref:DgyrCDS10091 n=1 Tax=Dimorphilus gyrociliatus TaxID=2664684 RepID=A0A7I8W0B0_9ANNE|nr:DgyrCDS10091 [Dimorphilus gyrociliatus]
MEYSVLSPKGRNFGQPVSQTHPELLREDEVTPGITRKEYNQRRLNLIEHIQNSLNRKDVIAVIPSASTHYMSYEVPYPFRQDTDFMYLTGFQEPDSCLVFDLRENKSILFVPKKDPMRERWDGLRMGSEKALTFTCVDETYNNDMLPNYLKKNCQQNLILYDYKHDSDYINGIIRSEVDKSVAQPINFYIHKLRLTKSKSEIELMRKTCQIASEMFIETMKFSKIGVNEAHIHSKLDFECRQRNAQHLAFPPVVAGGGRGTIIHYLNNNRQINDEMVLVDAGSELHGYVSDVTRTWPVGGRFKPEHLALYEGLLEVQQKVLQACVKNVCLEDLYLLMLDLLGSQLKRIGVIKESVKGMDIKRLVRQICPHHVGHFLGMDVHDTHTIPRGTQLHHGMIITVEPGIYITNDMAFVPEYFRNTAIRIEDDVLITDGEPDILTKNCPKLASDIEKLVNC